jgi:hypothetical protein
MNKITVSCLILAASISTLVGAAVAGNTGASPEAIESWGKKVAKIDWHNIEPDMKVLLTKVPTPPPAGDNLTDRYGNKSHCHQMSSLINDEGKIVTTWNCWSAK